MNENKIVEAIKKCLQSDEFAESVYSEIAPLIEARVEAPKPDQQVRENCCNNNCQHWDMAKPVNCKLGLYLSFICSNRITPLPSGGTQAHLEIEKEKPAAGDDALLKTVTRRIMDAGIAAPYIQRQTPEEPKLISVEELQEKFISYFQDLPLWGSYKNMSSALVNIAAPYIRQKEERVFPPERPGDPGEEPPLTPSDEERLEESVAEIVLRQYTTDGINQTLGDRTREIIRLVSALKDTDIERYRKSINEYQDMCGKLAKEKRKAEAEIERLRAELSVFKEGMRAIKSALDFVQAN